MLRPRLLVLAAAGALLVGFGLLWALALKDKHDDLDDGPDEPENKQTTTMKKAAVEDGASKKEVKTNGDVDEVKAEFNAAKQKAFDLFKSSPPKYDEAAVWFTRAIELAEAHVGLASQRVALYNNRSACRERCTDLEASLEDCAVVLESNAMHAKVRRRRARIYEKLGRYSEALTEICADLLIQREGFKKSYREGRTPEQPSPVENVESVMRAVGRDAAETIVAARGPDADFGMPSVNTVTQLLMTYASYSDRVREAEAEAADTELAAAVAGAPAKADEVVARLRRAQKFTYTKRYAEAADDVSAAERLLREAAGEDHHQQQQQGSSSSSSSSLPAALEAEVWRFVGLYRHLVHDLDGARIAYEKSLAVEGAEVDPATRVEVRVKRAGVFVDAGDMAAADAELGLALAEEAGDAAESDVFMHRAQLHVIRRDLEAAQRDLERCIRASPRHVLALLRLATVLIHNGASPEKIQKHITAAERLAPRMSEVYQVKGEIFLARNDMAAAVAEFDRAIALDAHNPVPLYNKGLALIQMNPAEAQAAEALFERALTADPTCMVALMRLAELRLQLAASFDQAQTVVDMLGEAMLKCRDKDELVELATVRCMAIAQLAAAKAVGLTSFQM